MKFTRMLGVFVAGTTLAVAAFGSAAGADAADDLQIIVDNIPATVDAVTPALQAILDTYEATNSFEMTGFTAIQQSMTVSAQLVQGTEQFAMLPLGFLLVAAGGYGVAQPYLQALDDPSKAADLVNPDDVGTIAGQVADALDPLSNQLTIAVIEGLQGNLTAGTGLNAGLGTPAAVGNTFVGTANLLDDLLDNTNYEALGLFYRYTFGVAAIASAGYVQDAEDALAPVFEALAPVTDPLIEALGG